MTTRGDIGNNLAQRLATLTAANGYATDVKKVYYDKIPMGLALNDYELPAIFLLSKHDKTVTQQDNLVGAWEFVLQIWNNQVSDTDMLQFEGDIFRAIYANSPTAAVSGAFRAIHPAIVEIIPLSISSDLQMIEANRISVISFQVHYRTKLYNL